MTDRNARRGDSARGEKPVLRAAGGKSCQQRQCDERETD
jgi:hypothetical protein